MFKRESRPKLSAEAADYLELLAVGSTTGERVQRSTRTRNTMMVFNSMLATLITLTVVCAIVLTRPIPAPAGQDPAVVQDGDDDDIHVKCYVRTQHKLDRMSCQTAALLQGEADRQVGTPSPP